MKTRDLSLILILILAIIGTFGYLAYHGYSPASPVAPNIQEPIGFEGNNASSTGTFTDIISSSEDVVVVKLNEKRKIKDSTVNVWAIMEDSRCPATVQCIQAGKVRVAVSISSPFRYLNTEMEPGKKLNVGSFILHLREVTPAKTTIGKISDKDYRFIFEVLQANSAPKPLPRPVEPTIDPPVPDPGATSTATSTNPNQGGCYVGGCSGQICSDDPNAVSTCEYREEYACYKQSSCERQASGQCGWTETPELKACLMNGGRDNR
jgi:hypothetical protein